jgi:uncharacterized protein (TIGR02147 family)
MIVRKCPQVGYTPAVAAALPDLATYLAYRAYLADWFTAQKAANPRYSHRMFARRAGVRSPSLLAEVIAGRRNLTPATIDGFARALSLGRDEAALFHDLVAFDQAADHAEKNAAWERIAASRRFRGARPIDGAMVRYLSHWYIPATRELALRADFQPDPAWVAAALLPKITASQARDALDTLLAIGLLVERDGRTVPADVSVATPHEVAGLAAHNYHREMLERASDAIGTVLPKDRHLCGVTVAIPARLVPQLKRELDAFQERLLHLCDETAGEAERVYQIGLYLVPLSRGREDS